MTQSVDPKFHLEQFRSISHAISTYDDLDLLLQHITEGVTRTFRIKGACILILDEKENQMFIVSSHGISREYLDKGPILIDSGQSAMAEGKPVYVENMQSDPRVQYPREAEAENIVSMLSIPIKFKGTVTGLLRIYHDQPLQINEQDVESLGVLLEHLGVVIENNGLNHFIDHLKVAVNNLPPRLLGK